MHHLKAVLQPIPRSVVPQTRSVFGIAIKSHNPSQITHKPCAPKSNTPKMRADVIDNGTRPNRN
jgi:hypothetical protein